jgi:hypothetical protein
MPSAWGKHNILGKKGHQTAAEETYAKNRSQHQRRRAEVGANVCLDTGVVQTPLVMSGSPGLGRARHVVLRSYFLLHYDGLCPC